MKSGAVPRSPGIYLVAEKTPRKPHLGDRVMNIMRPVIVSNGVSYLQIASVGSPSMSWRREGRRKELLSWFLAGHLLRVSYLSINYEDDSGISWGLYTDLLAFTLRLRKTPARRQSLGNSHPLKWGPFSLDDGIPIFAQHILEEESRKRGRKCLKEK